MQNQNPGNYQALMNYLFNRKLFFVTSRQANTNPIFTATDGVNSAGLSYVRVPLGASDFSANGRYS